VTEGDVSRIERVSSGCLNVNQSIGFKNNTFGRNLRLSGQPPQCYLRIG
jgi:hypothetical protein